MSVVGRSPLAVVRLLLQISLSHVQPYAGAIPQPVALKKGITCERVCLWSRINAMKRSNNGRSRGKKSYIRWSNLQQYNHGNTARAASRQHHKLTRFRTHTPRSLLQRLAGNGRIIASCAGSKDDVNTVAHHHESC